MISCSICLEEILGAHCLNDHKIVFSQHSDCSQLRCGHLFHTNCIKTWIRKGNPTQDMVGCPMCRQDIVFTRSGALYSLLLRITRMIFCTKILQDLVPADDISITSEDTCNDSDVDDSGISDDDNNISEDTDSNNDDDISIVSEDTDSDTDDDELSISIWHETQDVQVEFFRAFYRKNCNLCRRRLFFNIQFET